MKANKQQLTPQQQDELLKTLQSRFEKNTKRHKSIEWTKVQERLLGHPSKLWSLNEMEITGGEPDVIAFDKSARLGRVDRIKFFARRLFHSKNGLLDAALRCPLAKLASRSLQENLVGHIAAKNQWRCHALRSQNNNKIVSSD